MIDNKLLRIIDTARKEEVFVYEALKDLVFREKLTYIGDDIQNGLADIFTDDFMIGVEVVTCERRIVHKFTEKNRLPIHFSMNVKSNKTINKPKTQNINKFSLPYEEIYMNLKKSITKKLKLLKNGNYDGTEEIFLCICSVFEEKPCLNIEFIAKIYDECTKKLNAKFDIVFLLVNKSLYIINDNNQFALIEEYENSNILVDKINK